MNQDEYIFKWNCLMDPSMRATAEDSRFSGPVINSSIYFVMTEL